RSIENLMQMTAGYGRVAVAVGDDLALLGDADGPLHRGGRLREDREVGRAAAAPDATAPPVELLQQHAAPLADVRQRLLRLVQPPLGHQVAAVIRAVRVADNSLLAASARGISHRIHTILISLLPTHTGVFQD